MKKTLFICLLFIAIISANAQDTTVQGLKASASQSIKKDVNDTIPQTWKTGGIFSLNIAQGSLSNWAAGGDDFSLSVNTYLNAYAFYKKGKNSWDNNLDINFGYLKTTSLGARKNDDRIDFLSKYGYALNKKLNVAGLFDFRTQFFKGYSYPDANTKILSSNFMAPAYILLGIGLDYHPVPELSIFISPLTSRWTIVNDDSLSAQGAYGVAPGKKSINAIGAYVSINYQKNFNSILSYAGRLDLFSNYKSHPQNVDLYMTNLFAVKLSKVLSATYSLDLIYDDDVKLFGPNHDAPGLQVKSLVGVGLLVKL
ncbi:MAG: DUF3078 domain-containing protein [Chitinophagaceae bacterium]